MAESPVFAFITGSLHIHALRSVQASMKVGLVSAIRRILPYKNTYIKITYGYAPWKRSHSNQRDSAVFSFLYAQNYFWWRQRHADINYAVNFHMARGNCVIIRSTRLLECMAVPSAKQVLTCQQCLYQPWTDLRVPEGWGSQISRQSAHEGGKVVSPTHL